MTCAVTPCPLCVPARAAMITGLLPSNNHVLFNFNSIHSDQATFLHSLTVHGYETVLCGRMHFVGPDQRHGYARRIAGDRTPVFHNGVKKSDTGKPTKVTGFDENGSVRYIGGGDSPVLAYDRYVVEHALDYLKEDHEKPQFITVGTYGPHFPYVAPKELYDYYYDKVSLEDVTDTLPGHPALDGKLQETDPEVARAARAAYYGLVEQQDRHIGQVYDAFQEYLKRTGREGVFLYVSDHGDMNGTRGYYGKQVFYDASARIPFLLAGAAMPRAMRSDTPARPLYVGAPVRGLTVADILEGDGQNLAPLITGAEEPKKRLVVSELYSYLPNGDSCLGRMVTDGRWKYLTYSGYPDDDVLYDMEQDPQETFNVIHNYPEKAKELHTALEPLKTYEEVAKQDAWFLKQLKYLMRCDFDDDFERWHCPELEELENPVCTKQPFAQTPWARELMRRVREN